MTVTHGDARYELDDDWWEEAGMAGFLPTRRAFRAATAAFPDLDVVEVAVAEVKPVDRQLSHGVFNDSPSAGTARQRVVHILKGFRDDSPIPPVELLRLPEGRYQYELYHGAHRFYCAVAAGFSAVPAVDVTHRPTGVVDLDAPEAAEQGDEADER